MSISLLLGRELEPVDMRAVVSACAVLVQRERLVAAWLAFVAADTASSIADAETLSWPDVVRAMAHRESEVSS